MCIAKWFLSTQVRTISYYWKNSHEYVLCPHIFWTTLIVIKERGAYYFAYIIGQSK